MNRESIREAGSRVSLSTCFLCGSVVPMFEDFEDNDLEPVCDSCALGFARI